MSINLDRRRVLKQAALGCSGMLLPLGRYGWALAGTQAAPARLVVVMLRGAVDGLNVVAPYAEPEYAAARPTIGLKAPGVDGGALDLDGHFGLHPALAPLMPLWQQQKLAFVHACGSPDPSRSHFDAQNFMENGTPGIATTPDGWMNRLVGVLQGPHGPTQAISLGPTRPKILSGPRPNTNFPLGPNADKPTALDRPAIASAFAQLYAGNAAMDQVFQQGLAGRQELIGDLQQEEQIKADNGAPPPEGFPAVAGRLARLMVDDRRIQLAFVDLGGWDTHVDQGGAQGQLAGHLAPLGQGLSTLAQGLGSSLDETTIVVMSEFGRTVHENGDGGTDHGHGNVMWVIGGRVGGGQVYGQWPGLTNGALYEARDLAVTTDFRTVIGTVLERHLGLGDDHLNKVLPNMPPADKNLGALLRA